MYELRDLPGVDALIQDESLEVALSRFGPAAVKEAIRDIQNDIRESKKVPEWSINPSGYLSPIFQALDSQTYRTIFNLTGTIIHSNLGRALIDPSIIEEITPLLSRLLIRPCQKSYLYVQYHPMLMVCLSLRRTL